MADEPIVLPEIVVTARAPDLPVPPIPPDVIPPPPPAPPPAEPKKPSYPDDTVTLVINGERFTGWQDVRIVRGIELFPSHFVLRLTERLPGQSKLLAIEPGQVCRVLVGQDKQMTGYIDTYEADVSSRGHRITVVGRSATQDLVDCAAGVEDGKETQARMTYSVSQPLQLAQTLCAPFGITVTAPDGEGEALVSLGDGLGQITVPLGASVYDVLEPIARWKQLLLMDDVDGNLLMAKVGTKKAGSGFTLPGSVLDARVAFRKQDRFTVYLPALSTFDTSFDVSNAAGRSSGNFLTPVKDEGAFKGQLRIDGKLRYRPHFVVSEQQFDGIQLAQVRARWEMARRYGRSQAVTATVPLWRDAKGTLWTPNTLAPVDMPVMKLAKLEWLISQVVFQKGFGGGTRTTATLMPADVFKPQPSFYTAFDPQIAAAQEEVLRQTVRTPGNPNFNPRAGDAPGGI